MSSQRGEIRHSLVEMNWGRNRGQILLCSRYFRALDTFDAGRSLSLRLLVNLILDKVFKLGNLQYIYKFWILTYV